MHKIRAQAPGPDSRSTPSAAERERHDLRPRLWPTSRFLSSNASQGSGPFFGAGSMSATSKAKAARIFVARSCHGRLEQPVQLWQHICADMCNQSLPNYGQASRAVAPQHGPSGVYSTGTFLSNHVQQFGCELLSDPPEVTATHLSGTATPASWQAHVKGVSPQLGSLGCRSVSWQSWHSAEGLFAQAARPAAAAEELAFALRLEQDPDAARTSS